MGPTLGVEARGQPVERGSRATRRAAGPAPPRRCRARSALTVRAQRPGLRGRSPRPAIGLTSRRRRRRASAASEGARERQRASPRTAGRSSWGRATDRARGAASRRPRGCRPTGSSRIVPGRSWTIRASSSARSVQVGVAAAEDADPAYAEPADRERRPERRLRHRPGEREPPRVLDRVLPARAAPPTTTASGSRSPASRASHRAVLRRRRAAPARSAARPGRRRSQTLGTLLTHSRPPGPPPARRPVHMEERAQRRGHDADRAAISRLVQTAA